MKTTRQKKSPSKEELLVRKRLAEIVRDWAGENKKIFWKYEVSSFYKSYVIKVANLPNPSTEDIKVSSNNRLLNNQEKTQLSDAIKNEYPETETLNGSSIDVQIDYVSGSVIAEIV